MTDRDEKYLSAGSRDYITVIDSQGIFGAGVVEGLSAANRPDLDLDRLQRINYDDEIVRQDASWC